MAAPADARPLAELLSGRVVALVGAGGKTSLMNALAGICVARGERVIRTTTTKMRPPEREPLVLLDDVDEGAIDAALSRSPVVALGARVDHERNKLIGVPPEVVDRLAAANLADRILVEADGARMLSLKAPAEHEPVVPVSTDMTIGLMGGDAVGTPMDAERVFRPELLAALAGKRLGDPVDATTLAALVDAPHGLFKGTPKSAKRVAFVNKLDRFDAVHVVRAAATRSMSSTTWLAGSVRQGWFIALD